MDRRSFFKLGLSACALPAIGVAAATPLLPKRAPDPREVLGFVTLKDTYWFTRDGIHVYSSKDSVNWTEHVIQA